MSKQGPHDKLIAAAAKDALGPLGFWRKGRSRLWIADRGFWLSLVEFQPSGFSKGSYLNVSAHWLWSPTGEYSFNFSERVPGFIEYANDQQFAPLAAGLAKQAADASSGYAEMFTTIDRTAEALFADFEKHIIAGRPGGWPAFHLAVAAMLAGREDIGQTFFERAAEGDPDDIVAQAARRFEAEAPNRERFSDFISERIRERRVEYGLSELTDSLFEGRGEVRNVS